METERMDPRVILYDTAMKHVGLPYRWGGDDPIHGYDCSGFVLELLRSVGAFPKAGDATAAEIMVLFDARKPAAPTFGTLAFFGASKITHVAFCLNETLMLEAGGGGSKTLTTEDAAEQNAYIRVRPIRNRVDLVGFRHPPYPWRDP